MKFETKKTFEIDEKEFLQRILDDIIYRYLDDDLDEILDDFLADNVDDYVLDDSEDLYYDMKDKLSEYCKNIIKAKLTLEKPEEESDEPEEPTENVLVVDTGKRKIDIDAKKIADDIDDYFTEYTVNNWDWAEWTAVVRDSLVDMGLSGAEIDYLYSTKQMTDIVKNVRDSYPYLQ